MIKAFITQSNYIPWKGYFDAIAMTDVFVVYDDMQYTKQDWRNRNLIKTVQGSKWLSIPVEIRNLYSQKIKDTKVADRAWTKKHLDTLKHTYCRAASYKETIVWVEEVYKSCTFEYLTEINLHFIQAINEFLGISTEIRLSSEFILAEERTQRLVDICKNLQATDYYSGPAAKAYMDESLFEKENIDVHYLDYSGYREYRQLHPPFEHGVSILDLLFNEGEQAKYFLKTEL